VLVETTEMKIFTCHMWRSTVLPSTFFNLLQPFFLCWLTQCSHYEVKIQGRIFSYPTHWFSLSNRLREKDGYPQKV